MRTRGAKGSTPSGELERFTDREKLQDVFRRHLAASTRPPVLVFYGVGGAGKTWLLRTLYAQVPDGIPRVILDFGNAADGRLYASDPIALLQEIRNEFRQESPRFDLAYAMLHHKKGVVEKSNAYLDLAAELAGCVIPGAGTILKGLKKPILKRIKGTGIESFLTRQIGNRFVRDLKSKSSQQISDLLLGFLAEDLRETLGGRFDRAVRAVIFLDTFEAVGTDCQSEEHRRQREEWIQGLAAEFDFALTVIAGQNRIDWYDADPDSADELDQHRVAGLSESDARSYLEGCGIVDRALQDSIVATAREGDGGHHCFSLGLCADTVYSERSRGIETTPQSMRFSPGNLKDLANRFLKALASKLERCWIKRLSLTPCFDERTARHAYSEQTNIAQETAWDVLPAYSFVSRIQGRTGWFEICSPMRKAVGNDPTTPEQVCRDHRWWQQYWTAQSSSRTDREAALAWYHQYCLSPEGALAAWKNLAEDARTSVPPRMGEHFALIHWWDPVALTTTPIDMLLRAKCLVALAIELQIASVGDCKENLLSAIRYCDEALFVFTEARFPQSWATTKVNLGNAWSDISTQNRFHNLRRAISCYEAALRVFSEEKVPKVWAEVQNNLGTAWTKLQTGNLGENLLRAIAYYQAALRVCTERAFPKEWATTQNNLGVAWTNLPKGDFGENFRYAIACFDSALRVHTEKDFPRQWAALRNNLGTAWHMMPIGDRSENLSRAIVDFEASLRVCTEREFPQEWARTQHNLAMAWCEVSTGDRGKNQCTAIAHCEAALRVYTEQEFPEDWARAQITLGDVRRMSTGDRSENTRVAVSYYEDALRVLTEEDSPQLWAITENNLGNAWCEMPNGDRGENLGRAIRCYQAAMRVFTEQTSPLAWAKTQSNLGDACRNLPTGQRDQNLRWAISCYEDALRVTIGQDLPNVQNMIAENLRDTQKELTHLES